MKDEHKNSAAYAAGAEILHEYVKATEIYGPFSSYHEGYAIILEELEELWDEIKKKPEERNSVRIKREAIQTAAMCLRFIVDCTN